MDVAGLCKVLERGLVHYVTVIIFAKINTILTWEVESQFKLKCMH